MAIGRLIEPLIANKTRIEVRRLGAGSTYTVGVLPKGTSPASVIAADQLRVPSRVPGVFFNYYEVWEPRERGAEFALERSYLHVYHKVSRDTPDKQLLSLHCDPLLDTQVPEHRYKKGPHLHVGGAVPNIDRAHLSLCVSDPDHGGADIARLSETLSEAIKMIGVEVFPRYSAA